MGVKKTNNNLTNIILYILLLYLKFSYYIYYLEYVLLCVIMYCSVVNWYLGGGIRYPTVVAFVCLDFSEYNNVICRENHKQTTIILYYIK